MPDHSRKIAMAALSNLCAPDDMRTIWIPDLRDDVVRYIKQVEQERDQLKAILYDINTTDYRFSVDQLAEHDAEVIEKLRDYLSGIYCGDYKYVIDEYINQLRQKAQEQRS